MLSQLKQLASFRVTELTAISAEQAEQLAAMKEKLNWEETQRRKLHNMVQAGRLIFC